jgi:GAF domain-containing protein
VDGRLDAITEQLSSLRIAGRDIGTYLCDMCAEVTGMAGAGIMLMTDGQHRGMVGASDPTAHLVEELQFTMGEGPCVDAWHERQPVLEPDLAAPATSRWPGFTQPAVDAGVRSIFGIPLDNGGLCVGALDLYDHRPGSMSDRQLDDAVAMGRVVADAVITMQADAEPGTVADGLQPALRYQAVVHQAVGMLSARLDITVDEALVRLRAYSYAQDRSIRDVSRSIVNRTFDFRSTSLT